MADRTLPHAENVETLRRDFAEHFSPTLLARLESLGHAQLESAAQGAWITIGDGRRFLDCYSAAGIHNLGRHPRESAAALQQAVQDTDQGNFPMLSEEKVRLAASLAEFAPGELDCSVFAVARAEAVEFACKLARGFTERTQLLAVEGGFHGETGFALSLSSLPGKDRFGTLIPDVGLLPANDLVALEHLVTPRTAAVLVEPVQVENHCRVLSSTFLQALADQCRRTGALLVVDEGQTAFGRAGQPFSYQESGIQPDVVAMGEALGGGMFPIAVTMLTQRVNAFMNAHPMIHLSTFGGHDAGCRVAYEALNSYRRLKPWENAAAMGQRLLRRAEQWSVRHPDLLTSVAGKGLAVSLKTWQAGQAVALCKRLSDNGVLARPGRIDGSSVLLRPSLLVTEEEMSYLEQAVEASLR